MSKTGHLPDRVPSEYNRATIADIIRSICGQVDSHSEGVIAARYQARASIPVSVAAAVGDIVWDSNATVTNGTVRLGWICNVSSPTAPTFQEVRVLAGSSLTLAQLNALISDADVGLTLGTEVAATSGTSIDFTGIPSWAKMIVILFAGISTNGNSNYLVQLGTSSGVETTGYLGSSSQDATPANYTTGLGVNVANAAAAVHGAMTLTLENSSSFRWVGTGVFGRSDGTAMHFTGGSKSLSAALDRVRITTVGGVNTFDAGAFNIMYQ